MIGGACVAFGGAPGRELCVRHGRSVCGTLTKNVARLQKVCSPYLRAGQGAWGYDIGWVKGQCKHGLVRGPLFPPVSFFYTYMKPLLFYEPENFSDSNHGSLCAKSGHRSPCIVVCVH